MECKNARLLLDFACPQADELTDEDARALEEHLAGCPHCAKAAQSQRRFDHSLGLAMRHVEVPDGLRDRILARVAPGPAASRRWLLHAARGTAAAAALLLLVWGWWQWRAASRPAPDVPFIFEQVNHGLPRPDRAGLTEAFERLGVSTRLPNLDYAYLSSYGIEELPGMPGKRVPCLRFERAGGKDRARVYVLSGEDFDLSALPERAAFDQGYDYKLEIRHSVAGRYAYLIFYTGDNFSWILPEHGA
jgi:hypothetical protein